MWEKRHQEENKSTTALGQAGLVPSTWCHCNYGLKRGVSWPRKGKEIELKLRNIRIMLKFDFKGELEFSRQKKVTKIS